jgi:hypothetical protein
MKTSWIIFIVLTYAAIWWFAGIMQQSNLLNPTSTGGVNIQALGQPSATNFGGIAAVVSQVVNVWNYLVGFIKMVFLYNPTVWSGYWIYFYYFICLPICIGMVMSIVFILRGVHNN